MWVGHCLSVYIYLCFCNIYIHIWSKYVFYGKKSRYIYISYKWDLSVLIGFNAIKITLESDQYPSCWAIIGEADIYRSCISYSSICSLSWFIDFGGTLSICIGFQRFGQVCRFLLTRVLCYPDNTVLEVSSRPSGLVAYTHIHAYIYRFFDIYISYITYIYLYQRSKPKHQYIKEVSCGITSHQRTKESQSILAFKNAYKVNLVIQPQSLAL